MPIYCNEFVCHHTSNKEEYAGFCQSWEAWVEEALKWWKTARGLTSLVSIICECGFIAFVIYIVDWAKNPIRVEMYPPLPEYYFIDFYKTIYGYVFTIFFIVLGIIIQTLFVQRLLDHLDPKELHLQQKILTNIAWASIVMMFVIASLGTFGVALLYLLLVVFLLPALWPTYIVIRQCERKQQAILIFYRMGILAKNLLPLKRG